MSFAANNILCCPMDKLPLRQQGNCLRCDNGHSFDLARLGYANLLSAADKRSKDPGDSKAMVAARRQFLDGGHYQPIADKLVELASPVLGDQPVIIDAGCGEGFYLQELMRQIALTESSRAAVVGFDISKWAIQAAARRLPATWLVASNRNIPVADCSVDLLLSLFGFPAFDSFHRILKPGAHLLLVDAGPRHLLELRQAIYPRVKMSEAAALDQAPAPGFSLVSTTSLRYTTVPLSQLVIGQLFTMTPHFYRASHEGKARAALLDQLAVTVDVNFHLLHRQ